MSEPDCSSFGGDGGNNRLATGGSTDGKADDGPSGLKVSSSGGDGGDTRLIAGGSNDGEADGGMSEPDCSSFGGDGGNNFAGG
uniref:Uncharacterized protein n=1 Tax=Peronospora matthiolae TaxID=2874970 RepID=A0AAV1TEC7_9STRA